MTSPLTPRRYLRVLLLVTLATAPIALAAQTVASAGAEPPANASRSTDPLQAIITDRLSFDEVDGKNTLCRDHDRVVVKIYRDFAPDNNRSVMTCGKVVFQGRNVTLQNEDSWKYRYLDVDPFFALEGRVTTAVLFDIGWNVDAYVGASKLIDADGNPLNVRSESRWREAVVQGQNISYECPENTALIAFGMLKFICGTIWQGNPPATTPSGTITLRDSNNKPCSIPAPNGPRKQIATHMLAARLSPCASNIATSIELEALPSATRILLTDTDSCEKKLDPVGDDKNMAAREEEEEPIDPDKAYFWIELLTIEKSVTMSELNIDEFFGFAPDAIVHKGLKLVGFERHGSELGEKRLSCVQITTSAAPPSA